MKVYFLIFAFSLLAMLTHGYAFGVSDQEIFIPYIINGYDNTLFAGDKLLDQESAKASFFYPAISFLLNFVGIEHVFFVGFLIWQFLFFLALFWLSRVILKNEKLAVLSLLLYFSPKFIGGTATQTFDSFFGYRNIGIILLLVTLRYLLENNIIKASLVACLNLLVHPLSVIPSLIYFPVSLARKNLHLVIVSILLLGLTALWMGRIAGIDTTSRLGHFLDNDWLSIIRERNNFLFASQWSIYGWGSFFIYFLPIVIFLNKLTKNLRRNLVKFLLASTIVFVVNFFLLEVLASPFFASFQLVRSFNPLAYVGLSMTTFLLTGSNFITRAVGIVAFLSIATNQFYIYLICAFLFLITKMVSKFRFTDNIARNTFFLLLVPTTFYWLILNFQTNKLEKVIEYPKPQSDWIKAQMWAKENTKKNEIFLTDPYLTGFRIYSQRSIVGDVKDGGVNIYSPDFAKYWYGVMRNTRGLKNFNDRDVRSLKESFQFNYLITYNNHVLTYPVIYSNQKYRIYKTD